MSTIETNTNQEFDPDSLLGNTTEELEEVVPERFNCNLQYSIFEPRPTSELFETKHEIQTHATYFHCKKSSNGFVFEVMFECSASRATELIVHYSQNNLNIIKFDFENLKVDMSSLQKNNFSSVSYTETDRTNRTGNVLIKF